MRSTTKGMLFGLASVLVLGTPSPAAADEREDKAAAYLERIGGKVTRDAARQARGGR
jgi:hypothetical protein